MHFVNRVDQWAALHIAPDVDVPGSRRALWPMIRAARLGETSLWQRTYPALMASPLRLTDIS